MTCDPSYQSLLKRENYSSGDIDEYITNIQTKKISQVKAVREYVIPCWTLERKCKKKRYNVAYNRPGPTPVMKEATEKDLVQWAHAMQKRGIPVGRYIIIQKAQEIHHYMYGSLHYVGSVGCGWCKIFMILHHKLTLRLAWVIKLVRNKALNARRH